MGDSVCSVFPERGMFRKGVAFARHLQMDYDWKKGRSDDPRTSLRKDGTGVSIENCFIGG